MPGLRSTSALAKEKFGKVDAVFANAGIMPAGNMSELKTDDWNAMIEVNIKGVLNTIAAVLPEFIAQKKGHIIVTSSRAGTMSVPGNAVYCGTKHFVRAMLDSFRSESVREGTNIRTTTIYPGAIKTELLTSFLRVNHMDYNLHVFECQYLHLIANYYIFFLHKSFLIYGYANHSFFVIL